MPAPLFDGLYWIRDADGVWHPMGVANGERFRLMPEYASALLPDDVTAPIHGPLVKPGAA